MKTKFTFFLSLVFITGILTAQNWALKFNPADENSFVDAGANAAFHPANLTLETWIYVDSWVGGGNYVLATEGWTEATGPMGYAIRLNPDIGAEFVLGLGANNWGVVASGYETIDSLEWYHVACTFDGSLMTVYVNGEFMLDQEVTGAIFPSDQNLILGEGATWRNRRFAGKMYDIRIWNVARTEEQIKATMDTYLTGTEEGLVANWKADEGTGVLLNDATGNHPASINSGVEWFALTTTSTPEQELHAGTLVYPNPAQNYLHVSNQQNFFTSYSIYDLLGKTLLSSRLQSDEINRIDISQLPKGIYIIKLENQIQSQVEKFVVK